MLCCRLPQTNPIILSKSFKRRPKNNLSARLLIISSGNRIRHKPGGIPPLQHFLPWRRYDIGYSYHNTPLVLVGYKNLCDDPEDARNCSWQHKVYLLSYNNDDTIDNTFLLLETRSCAFPPSPCNVLESTVFPITWILKSAKNNRFYRSYYNIPG